MRRFFALLAVVSLFSMVFSANAQEEPGTIADIVIASAEAGEFTVLLTAVTLADEGVLEALSSPDVELTVFAPTDAAFNALFEELGEEATDAILGDPEMLAEILYYHVVEGAADSTTVVGLLEENEGFFSVQTVQGQYIDIELTDEGIFIDDALLVLEMVDIVASNGIIHVIDAVLVPEFRTIAEVVIDFSSDEEAPEFTTLLAAVLAADPAVVEALSNEEASLTVFAPTDAAFAALGEDTINAVLADQELLTTILLYHVLDGAVYSSDLEAVMMSDMGMDDMDTEEEAVATEEMEMMMEDYTLEVTMLSGNTAVITIGEAGVFINDAEVVIFDVEAYNGVIHVIDAVILPE